MVVWGSPLLEKEKEKTNPKALEYSVTSAVVLGTLGRIVQRIMGLRKARTSIVINVVNMDTLKLIAGKGLSVQDTRERVQVILGLLASVVVRMKIFVQVGAARQTAHARMLFPLCLVKVLALALVHEFVYIDALQGAARQTVCAASVLDWQQLTVGSVICNVMVGVTILFVRRRNRPRARVGC